MVCRPPERCALVSMYLQAWDRPNKRARQQHLSSCCKADSRAGPHRISILPWTSAASLGLSQPLERELLGRQGWSWEDQARCGQLSQLNPHGGPILTCTSPSGPPKDWRLRTRPTSHFRSVGFAPSWLPLLMPRRGVRIWETCYCLTVLPNINTQAHEALWPGARQLSGNPAGLDM